MSDSLGKVAPQASAQVFTPTAEGNFEALSTAACDAEQAFSEPERAAVLAAIQAFVDSAMYPCVGAKSALNLGAYRVGLYAPLGSASSISLSTQDVQWFTHAVDAIDAHFATFIAVFHGPAPANEEGFSKRFWTHLNGMVARDEADYSWDQSVSANPEDPNFSLSIGGRAIFVVGMHPAASRLARRFPLTALVFNAHSQFEALREAGRFDTLRDAVRRRDRQLQGDENCMLADHGTVSEAAQYDGLPHASDWVAPIRRREAGPASVAASCPLKSRSSVTGDGREARS